MKVNKRTIFEIFLVAVIILEGIMIYRLSYTFSTSIEINKMKCFATIMQLDELFEAKKYDSAIEYGETLLKNEYKDDVTIYQMLAQAYYMKGDKKKAAEMLEASLSGKYSCEMFKPTSKRAIYIDDALTHNYLSKIYAQLDQMKRSEEEMGKAYEIVKLYFGEKYVDEDVKKLFNGFTFFNHDNSN